jgi:hypothetical protein
MKHVIMLFIMFSIVTLLKIPALAERKGLIETVAKGYLTELETYCKDVTPGEGRVLACLYAYEDKLSGKCEYTLYDVSAQLQRSMTELNYVASECRMTSGRTAPAQSKTMDGSWPISTSMIRM